MAEILIIDDSKVICDLMTRLFTGIGHHCTSAFTLQDGLEKARQGRFDVVFLDVQLPDGNGIQKISEIRAVTSEPEVIIITGNADPDGAELAIKENAWDYIKKPFSAEKMTLVLRRVLQYMVEKKASKPIVNLKRTNIIGESPRIKECLNSLARAAASNSNILIVGETGTGKELFAKAVHENSTRADKHFVIVDCGSIPASLMESILFGHVKGAYTGADKSQEGLIKHADGGTLFLDEIGELPLNMQKVFLRTLQERRFCPIGSTQEIESDFRLVAATNRDLETMVTQETFREDLLFRIRSIVIDLPPLRDRTEDIETLALNRIKSICESRQMGIKGIAPEFFDMLRAYSWPGNIRELHAALDLAVSHALEEQTLFPKHLPENIRVQVVRSSIDESSEQTEKPEEKTESSCNLPKWRLFRASLIAEGEKKYLTDLVALADGKVKNAAKISGLSQPRLYELLRKYNISI